MPAYQAAYMLQTLYGYKSFKHTLVFDDDYSVKVNPPSYLFGGNLGGIQVGEPKF